MSDQSVAIATLTVLVTQSSYSLWYDHKRSLLLRLSEVVAAATFSKAISIPAAKQQYLAEEHLAKSDAKQFDGLVSRMARAGLFCQHSIIEDSKETALFGNVDCDTLQALVDARITAHDDRVADEGKALIHVVPVNTIDGTTPASLGILMAYAMEWQGGRLRDKYNFVPIFLTDESRLVEPASLPSIFIFSIYVWNVENNLALSAAVKAVNPPQRNNSW